MFRWVNRACGESRSGEHPGRDRIGVPHLTGTHLISTPGQSGHPRHVVQEFASLVRILCENPRALNSQVGVRNRAVLPAPNLVSKQSPMPERATENWSFRYNPT